MSRRRATVAVVVATALVVAACGGDDGGDDGAVTTTTEAVTTTTVAAGDVALGPLLVNEADLAAQGFEAEAVGRPFAAALAPRIRLCGEDLRAELGLGDGRQSRFSDGEVEVTHTVTSGGDTEDLVERFSTVVRGCTTSWTDPPLPSGGGPVERTVTGAYPVPDVGLPAAGAVVRSRNTRGATDTVVVVLVDGPVVSSLSISGPVGADFDVTDPAIEAAARRLN